MARGELMKRLLASYGRDDDFRAVAEQIILEEEQKNNRVLARSLRRTLENSHTHPSDSRKLAHLIAFTDAAQDFVDRVEPTRLYGDVTMARTNAQVLAGLMKEF